MLSECSLHGLAFNVNTDLNYFDHIIPCGISSSEKSVTSLEKETGKSLDIKQIEDEFINHFIKLFDLNKIEIQ